MTLTLDANTNDILIMCNHVLLESTIVFAQWSAEYAYLMSASNGERFSMLSNKSD